MKNSLRDEVSPLTVSMMEALVQQSYERAGRPQMQKREPHIGVQFLDPHSTNMEDLQKQEDPKGGVKAPREPPNLIKSITSVLNGTGDESIERLAFETDPQAGNVYASVYHTKLKLIPDHILKRIAIQDDLVASIVNTRAAQVQSFGRPQPDRFSQGFKIIPDEGILDKMNPQEKEALEKRIDELQKKLLTCGSTTKWGRLERMSFPQYLGMSARNAVTVGRLATEFIYTQSASTGDRSFHSFRPIDAGTIYRAAPYKEAAQAVRDEATRLLEQLKNKDLEPDKFQNEEYAWIQVVGGKPVQAFTEDECVVHNFYPVADIEMDGYPVTPIDTAISAVTTHINITTHNRLFFQSGRATRGMIVIKSDDVNEDTITRIKHQFMASINNVANSWRMPVFAVGANDDLTWQSIDTNARDMEFQYLSDTNARVIMSAFQISPEELPGYQHLSRGTNNQALSESNNEYKLEAARDVGIRPLLAQFEDFINSRILPLLDEKLSKFCTFKFVGLDAETPEKESIRLTQDMGVHMTYDEVLHKVEKQPVGVQMGGQIPLNPQYRQILDAYFTVGQILEFFCGVKGAGDPQKNPGDAYRRDPFYFQNVQIQMQQQQMQQQAQQQAMGAAPAGGGQPPPGGGDSAPPAQDQGGGGQPPPDQQQGGDLSTGLDQVLGMLTKSEAQLPPSRRRLLEQQRKTVDKLLEHMESDLKKLTDNIVAEVAPKIPRE